MKNTVKKISIFVLISFFGTGLLFAQHEVGPSLSAQLFSRINYNPAGIGNNKDINIFSQTRIQWAGFDGHPFSSVLNGHYFNERLKSGFGASFTYDQLGPHDNTSLNAKIAYAYNIDLWEAGLLSLGAAAGIDQFSNDYSNAIGNSGIPLENESQMNPDFDFGFEFSIPWLLVGGSITHIAQTDDITNLTPTQTYYGYLRGSIDVNKKVMIAPSVLFMNNSQTNVWNINATVFYEKSYWAGLNFRPSSALAILVGMEWEWLRVGYSYEMSLGETTDVSSNTHELMLGFKIPMKRY
jgi:type IX secretion system PorP/SprF family membrane protein